MRTASGQRVSSLGYPPVTDQSAGYDYRYEFSETRKVLEEFFKAENEFPASSSLEISQELSSGQDLDYSLTSSGQDLDYSLTRLQSGHSGSSYVAQRLADAELDVVPVVSKPAGSLASPPYSCDLLDLVDTFPPAPSHCRNRAFSFTFGISDAKNIC